MTAAAAMQVLITRPQAEAAALQQRLQAMGFAADCAPLLDIRIRDMADLPLDGVAALLFTSANGVRAFVANCARRDFAVYAVGEASARAALAAGFRDVSAAGGDVDSLAELIRRKREPDIGALLHVAGTVLAGDLQATLLSYGYDVRRVALYEAIPAAALPAEVSARFKAGGYGAVLFFSPRTAATFVSLSDRAGIGAGAVSAAALCLSANVAKAAARLPWREIRVAAQPREEDLMALLQEADRP
ncbi:MAG TPA: uroporphyrinogen-III synthase [Ferrovibrio sp.]|uniref:uroporphyrinogen-III synthase n=1 Tax=Ferrovibrio sp. TaxID=1917215 RepID=UPI002ED1B4BD